MTIAISSSSLHQEFSPTRKPCVCGHRPNGRYIPECRVCRSWRLTHAPLDTHRPAVARYSRLRRVAAAVVLGVGLLWGGSTLTATVLLPAAPVPVEPPPLATYDTAVHAELVYLATLLRQHLSACGAQGPSNPATPGRE